MKFEDLAKEVQDKIMSRFANWDMDGKEAFENPEIFPALDLCMLDDRLPSTNEQICGRRIMAITRASQARDVGSIPIARSTNF